MDDTNASTAVSDTPRQITEASGSTRIAEPHEVKLMERIEHLVQDLQVKLGITHDLDESQQVIFECMALAVINYELGELSSTAQFWLISRIRSTGFFRPLIN